MQTLAKIKSIKFEQAFIAIALVAYSIVFLLTLSNYGVTFDEALGELYLGDKYFHFFITLDFDYLNIAKNNLEIYQHPEHPNFYATAWYAKKHAEHIWGFGPTFSAAFKYVFFDVLQLTNPIDAHHLCLLPLMLALLYAVFRFTNKVFGRWEAIFALMTLALYPRVWAHAHFNIKDVTSLVLFSLVIISFYSGIRYEKARWIFASAALWGLALATKGNALFLPIILCPWFVLIVLSRLLSGKQFITGRVLGALFVFPFIGVVVMLCAWPYLLQNFPNNIITHAIYLADRGLEGPDFWQPGPLIKAIVTMPIAVLILAVIGLGSMVYRFFACPDQRSAILLISIWLVIPILRVSIPYARDFDGIRHWLEFIPALAVIAGIGGAFLVGFFEALISRFIKNPDLKADCMTASGFVLLFSFFTPVLFWMYANHPYQIVYFNSIVGRLKGAQSNKLCGFKFAEATDYWASSYRQGLDWLNKNAEPDAVFFVGVAEHIIDYTPPAWIRSDLIFKPMSELKETLETLPRRQAIYMMYVTRKGWYPKQDNKTFFSQIDSQVTPSHQIIVDGAPILKILNIPRERIVL